jgi:hypothetical protein
MVTVSIADAVAMANGRAIEGAGLAFAAGRSSGSTAPNFGVDALDFGDGA